MKELAPGVWQFGGFPPNGINVYLLEEPDGSGFVLVDAATKLAKRRLERQLDGRRLSLVALTHAHADHQGVAKAMCEAHGIELACHTDDVDAMEGRVPLAIGAPNNPVNRIIHAFWEGPPHPVGRVLADGDTIAGFRVIHVPGHSPGHVAYFRESDRVAIAGDVLNAMNVFTGIPGLNEPPRLFTPDPARNRQSIRELAALRPSLACFGHGAPVRDAAEKLARFAEKLP